MENQSANKLIVNPEESIDLNKYKLLRLSPDEKEEYVDDLLLIYPSFKDKLLDMEKCRQSSHRLTELNCMFIAGDSRFGKSSLANAYMKYYPNIPTEEVVLKPVLYVKVPAPAYTGSLKSAILKALGDPFYAKTLRNFQSDYRITKLLDACKVELIILDEFQHLVEGNRQKVLIDSSDWFKNLIDDCRISVVFLGLPYAEKVFIENKQLGNRVRIRHSLKPFDFNDREFRVFLNNLDERLPFEEKSNLAQNDTWKRIYLAADGVIGHVKSLLIESTKLAAEENLPFINNDILFKAYNKKLYSLSSDNPFSPTYNLAKAIKKKIPIQ